LGGLQEDLEADSFCDT